MKILEETDHEKRDVLLLQEFSYCSPSKSARNLSGEDRIDCFQGRGKVVWRKGQNHTESFVPQSRTIWHFDTLEFPSFPLFENCHWKLSYAKVSDWNFDIKILINNAILCLCQKCTLLQKLRNFNNTDWHDIRTYPNTDEECGQYYFSENHAECVWFGSAWKMK